MPTAVAERLLAMRCVTVISRMENSGCTHRPRTWRYCCHDKRRAARDQRSLAGPLEWWTGGRRSPASARRVVLAMRAAHR